MNQSQALLKIARIISLLGHPLLLMPVTTVFIAFQLYDYSKATVVSSIIIMVVILPIIIHLTLGARKQQYTDFDVSNREQRKSFYRFGLSALGLAVAMLHFIPGAGKFFTGTLCALLMLFTFSIVNLRIKASLHTSVCIYVAFTSLMFNVSVAIGVFVFTVLVAISRLILLRHTIPEVLIGAMLGILFGMVLYEIN